MKHGGRIPWNVTAVCEVFRTGCPTGRHHTKDVLVNHSEDRSCQSVLGQNIIRYLREISHEFINLERKCFLASSLAVYFTREEFGNETYWSRIFEELEEMDASEMTPRLCIIRGGNLKRRYTDRGS